MLQALEISIFISSPLLAHFENGLGDIVVVEWLARDVTGVRIDILVLGAATVVGQGLQVDPMSLQTMLNQLLVPMILHPASFLRAIIDPLLGVPPMVLAPVAAGIEALVAEEALEWLLSRVDPFMHLEVRFSVEASAAHFFDTYD